MAAREVVPRKGGMIREEGKPREVWCSVTESGSREELARPVV